MHKKLIIAIDGPAGSGKSTVGKLIAKKLGLMYLDTGAMYRALTLKAMRDNIDLNDEKALVELAGKTRIELTTEADAEKTSVRLDGEDVTLDIRTPEVTDNIKYIARIPGVRKCMVKIQRAIGAKAGAVLEGRDTTTVVFPDAAHKFYLDADLKERARRRFKELRAMGMKAALRDVENDARRRDSGDKTRDAGPLKRASGAVYIDTTKMSVNEVVRKILSHIKNK